MPARKVNVFLFDSDTAVDDPLDSTSTTLPTNPRIGGLVRVTVFFTLSSVAGEIQGAGTAARAMLNGHLPPSLGGYKPDSLTGFKTSICESPILYPSC